MRILRSVPLTNGSGGRIREAQKQTDTTDPDPGAESDPEPGIFTSFLKD